MTVLHVSGELVASQTYIECLLVWIDKPRATRAFCERLGVEHGLSLEVEGVAQFYGRALICKKPGSHVSKRSFHLSTTWRKKFQMRKEVKAAASQSTSASNIFGLD